ncbi:hypothetical protein [Marinobacter sp. ELB17]|uniref:hypothetical protein n=1 Tax=Marinobacter sp. ELB17 TaxID=270374 RepID=UPI0002DB8205|nr:hypothetical protein [Marinobacter sp. ELB17]
MSLSTQDQVFFDTLKDWKSEGAELFIGGTTTGSFVISDDRTQFGRDPSRSFNTQLVEAIKTELGGTDARLNLQQSQRMLTTLDRFPLGIHNTHIAKMDRAVQSAQNDEDDDQPSPGATK